MAVDFIPSSVPDQEFDVIPAGIYKAIIERATDEVAPSHWTNPGDEYVSLMFRLRGGVHDGHVLFANHTHKSLRTYATKEEEDKSPLKRGRSALKSLCDALKIPHLRNPESQLQNREVYVVVGRYTAKDGQLRNAVNGYRGSAATGAIPAAPRPDTPPPQTQTRNVAVEENQSDPFPIGG